MKYIIDLDPFMRYGDTFPLLWQARGFRTLVFDQYGLSKLTPLNEENCIEHLRESGWMPDHDEEIYKQGYYDGLHVQNTSNADEIQIGDEVSFHYDDRPDTVMVVTDIYDQAGELHICGMDARGMQYAGKLAKCWEKTGRHFDQVAELMNAMRGNDG